MKNLPLILLSMFGCFFQSMKSDVPLQFDDEEQVVCVSANMPIVSENGQFDSEIDTFESENAVLLQDCETERSMGWFCSQEMPSPAWTPGDTHDTVQQPANVANSVASQTPQSAPEVTASVFGNGGGSYGSVGSVVSYGSSGKSYSASYGSSGKSYSASYGSAGSAYSYGSSGTSYSTSYASGYGSSGSSASYSSAGPVRRVLKGLAGIFKRGDKAEFAQELAQAGAVYHDGDFQGRENVFQSSRPLLFPRVAARAAWRRSDGHRANLPMLGLSVSRGPGGVAVVGRGR